jgi:glycosyltransferase involved in cell wall biosynthesis
LIELAKQQGIEHFLIFPNQPQPVLNEIYRAADVFVFPTLEDVWGLVVNEAMWTGTPVLCSQYAGCAPELLPESNIFDPMSPESFDAALAKIFDRSVSPPDCSKLKSWQEVGNMISRSLERGAPLSANE